MWDAKVLINDHLTIKHNPSMYTETFKVGFQPNSYRDQQGDDQKMGMK